MVVKEGIFYKTDEFTELCAYDEQNLPCENCTYKIPPCCVIFKVPLTPYESKRLLIDEDAFKKGAAYLAKKANGECIYLINGECSIWYDRPIACREYSCFNDERINLEGGSI